MCFDDTEILRRRSVIAVERDCATKRGFRIALASGGLVGEPEVILHL